MSSLIAISALATLLAVTVFEKLSPKALRESATRQLFANLFAIRLFADEPGIVLQSLLGVIGANFRLLLCAIPPMLVLAPAFYFLYGYLDSRYGVAPLTTGVPRVVTVKLDHFENIRLETPDWITVDSPPVHVFADREISWRIRPTRSGQVKLKVIAGSKVIEIDPRRNMFEPAPPMSFYGVSLNWTWWFAIWSVLSVVPIKLIASKILPMLSSTVSKSVRHSTSGISGAS